MDLRKLSVVYRKGFAHTNVRTRLGGFVVGTDGPDLFVSTGTVRGTQQTSVSKAAAPPRKWSYVELIGWWNLAFLSLGWIVFYVNAVTTGSSLIVSVALVMHVIVSGTVLLLLCFAFWKHNQFSFPAQYARWERSFVCQRCGEITEPAFRWPANQVTCKTCV